MVFSTQDTVAGELSGVDPHRKLMAAVLQTVVDDCRGTAYQRRHPDAHFDARDVRKAIAYVASTDRAWPFSFENLCDALGMDADNVRQRLEKGVEDDRTIETSEPV